MTGPAPFRFAIVADTHIIDEWYEGPESNELDTESMFHTFDRWLDFADLQGPLTLAVGRPVSVHCERAPEPSPGLRRDRLDARAPVFRTDAAIIELLAD